MPRIHVAVVASFLALAGVAGAIKKQYSTRTETWGTRPKPRPIRKLKTILREHHIKFTDRIRDIIYGNTVHGLDFGKMTGTGNGFISEDGKTIYAEMTSGSATMFVRLDKIFSLDEKLPEVSNDRN